MPALLIVALVSAGGGFVTGFSAGGGTDAIARAVKWGVIGGAGYLAFDIARKAKVI